MKIFGCAELLLTTSFVGKCEQIRNCLKKILVNNFGSSEFFINKAIGWSLRDYSKTNQDWVRNFVETHKDKMDKLSIREASKYL